MNLMRKAAYGVGLTAPPDSATGYALALTQTGKNPI
jgi:hypothetical protein